MDRPVFSNGASDSDNFRDDSATSGDHLKPPKIEERGLSTLHTDIEVRNSDTEPKDPDNHVNNSDDNNLIEVTEIASKVIVTNDVNDGRPLGMKKPPTYAAKKAVAQGLIDLALLTSNANQLRNLIMYQNDGGIAFFINLFLIVLSLILQITVGVFLIFKSRFASRGRKNDAAAARVNNQIMAAIFLITVINIFIIAFSIPSRITKNIL